MRFPVVKLSVFIVILALSKKEYNNGAVVTNTTSYEATVTSAALSWNKSKEETTAHPPSHNYRQDRREECYRERFGMDYRGTRDVTKSGKKCLTWEKGWERHQDGVFIPSSNWNDPPGAGRLEPTYKGSEWAGLENDKTYCRNPSLDKDGPWCYVEDKDIVKESCGIQNCEDPDSSDAFRPDGRCGLK